MNQENSGAAMIQLSHRQAPIAIAVGRNALILWFVDAMRLIGNLKSRSSEKPQGRQLYSGHHHLSGEFFSRFLRECSLDNECRLALGVMGFRLTIRSSGRINRFAIDAAA